MRYDNIEHLWTMAAVASVAGGRKAMADNQTVANDAVETADALVEAYKKRFPEEEPVRRDPRD